MITEGKELDGDCQKFINRVLARMAQILSHVIEEMGKVVKVDNNMRDSVWQILTLGLSHNPLILLN